ncbi:uncharacterized protein LOC133923560 [Phragmites australis]|uniref:uncharacterized protein LOC133923560 n=1 Tax=Phragmites australis TaxID=29695 RepID=UPI002D76F9BA|nr:uncharacterized protein LOC133923560 [Phragmites australis]
MFLHSLLMQKMAKSTQQPRKDGGARSGLSSKKPPWYQCAVEVLFLIWKQPAAAAPTATTKAAAASGVTAASGKAAAAASGPGKLRKSSSLNVAASFTRVCLCAPISSYNSESLYCFQADAAPRRSYSYPRASSASASGCGVSPLVAPPPAAEQTRGRSPAGKAGEGARRVFRGKSLTDDILMRRFVVDEEATRRRNEMEVIGRRHAAAAKRRRLGPSPLRRMALAGSEPEADKEAEASAAGRETDNSAATAVA